MDFAATTAKVSGATPDHLAKTLRDDHPWLEEEALIKLVDTPIQIVVNAMVEQEPAMKESRSKISFFSLSAELRNRIYELVLDPLEAFKTTHVHIQVTHATHYPGQETCDQFNNRSVLPRTRLPAGSLQLLQVCKQIRDGFKPMFWGTKTFWVGYEAFGESKCRKPCTQPAREWLTLIGKDNAKLIRNFRVHGMLFGVRKREVSEEEMLERFGWDEFGVRKEAVEIREAHAWNRETAF